MKTLLIIGDGDIHIKQPDVAAFGIHAVEYLTPGQFRAREDFADCIIMKGLIETSDFMRRVLEINKSLGGGFVSHCGVFSNFHQAGQGGGQNIKADGSAGPAKFILTDAALNIVPSLREKEGIVRNAVFLAHRIGLSQNPVVNFLTPSSKIAANIKSSVDACYLENFARENFPGIRTAHNALDVCFTDSAKAKNIEVAPRPDILVCDNIDQGNALYKSLTIFGGFMTAGFIVGNEKLPPVILTSRSDTKASKLWSVELSA
jgi:phosphate butyryltransferase